MAEQPGLNARVRPQPKEPFFEKNAFQGWLSAFLAIVLTVISMYSRVDIAHGLLLAAWICGAVTIWKILWALRGWWRRVAWFAVSIVLAVFLYRLDMAIVPRTSTTVSTPVGFMQFDRAWFNSKEFSTKEIVQISLRQWNAGAQPIDDVWWFFQVKVVPVGPQSDFDGTDARVHADMLADAIRDHERKVDNGEKPITVGSGHQIWLTMDFPPLKQNNVDDIIYGRSRIYVYAWGRWRGSSRDLDFCEWLQPPWIQKPVSTLIDNDKLIWRICKN